jgi:hypothetical protein
MATLEPVPTMRFLPVTGSVTARCPQCLRSGPLGKFCFQCCDSNGVRMGSCPVCNDCGQISKKCADCPHGIYEAETPWGTCRTCGRRGEQYQACIECRVDGRNYEYNIGNWTTLAQAPTIRFLPVADSTTADSTTGICPRCQCRGPVSKFCFKCCRSEGMLIGICPDCDDSYGQIAKMCNCPYGVFEDETP